MTMGATPLHVELEKDGALLREYLEAYTGTQRTQRALAGFAELADQSEAGSGTAGRTWTRDDLHDRSARP